MRKSSSEPIVRHPVTKTRRKPAHTPDAIQDARAQLLRWYGEHRRPLPWRATTDPYAIWVSELMCQQTRVDTVIPYFQRWMARFPDVQTLAQSPIEDALLVWQGLGYYRRARHLHAGAQRVVEDYDGRLPSDAKTLATLPGIGPYTAGAIASIAFQEQTPAVDGNVLRVLSRVTMEEGSISRAPAQRRIRAFAQDLVQGPTPGDLNQALMELGATICTPTSPACLLCPLANICRATREGRAESFPVKDAKKAARIEHAHAWLIVRPTDQAMFLAQRADDQLLGGLWEAPLLHTPPSDEAWNEEGQVRHLFSHIDLNVTLWVAREAADVPALPKRYQAGQWVLEQELDQFPQSTLMRKLLASRAR